ncbi:MAG: hypothetical protein O3C10_11820 [Chloroflexi bacterium]|nr:hypothetical protein [Chloroflexota bacterium]
MPQRTDQSRVSEFDQYVAHMAVMREAASRAQATHRERRERAFGDEKDRNEAQAERAIEAAGNKVGRAAEFEAERVESDRRGIDPHTERSALAKERHRGAVVSRDESQRSVLSEQADAILSAAHQAVGASREHAAERASANDLDGAEFRSGVEVRVEIAARLRAYRSEREIEQVKIDGERRDASSMMAHQARETRRIRELGDIGAKMPAGVDSSNIRAISDLVGQSRSSATETSKPAAKSGTSAAEIAALQRVISGQNMEPTSKQLVDAARLFFESEAKIVPSMLDQPVATQNGRPWRRKLSRVFRRAA